MGREVVGKWQNFKLLLATKFHYCAELQNIDSVRLVNKLNSCTLAFEILPHVTQ